VNPVPYSVLRCRYFRLISVEELTYLRLSAMHCHCRCWEGSEKGHMNERLWENVLNCFLKVVCKLVLYLCLRKFCSLLHCAGDVVLGGSTFPTVFARNFGSFVFDLFHYLIAPQNTRGNSKTFI
jgi:hypothetical protein